MPSPCEVPPNQPEQLTIAQITMDGEKPRGRTVHRVIPAMAGGMFAGLLLIGLGCTPFFQPRGAKAAGENALIVQAAGAAKENGQVVTGGGEVVSGDSAHAAARAPAGEGASSASAVVGGVPTIAASSSSRGGVNVAVTAGSSEDSAAGEGHRFSINCDPMHPGDDKITLRPESVALQGILASNASKAALLDGVLYREGDQFGAKHCPWTIAGIDAASVRIEKTFGDRVCGVTIRMSKTEKAQAASASSTPKAASTRTTAARSR